MNIRQLRYKANRIKGMNRYNAAIAAEYSHSYASKQIKKVENVVKSSILDTLEQAGLTDKYQANKLYELTLSENEKVRLEALKHISDLKKQTGNTPIIDQSRVTNITITKTYKEKETELQTDLKANDRI